MMTMMMFSIGESWVICDSWIAVCLLEWNSEFEFSIELNMHRQIDDGHKCYGLWIDCIEFSGKHYHLINMPFENLFHIYSMCRSVDDDDDDGGG